MKVETRWMETPIGNVQEWMLIDIKDDLARDLNIAPGLYRAKGDAELWYGEHWVTVMLVSAANEEREETISLNAEIKISYYGEISR